MAENTILHAYYEYIPYLPYPQNADGLCNSVLDVVVDTYTSWNGVEYSTSKTTAVIRFYFKYTALESDEQVVDFCYTQPTCEEYSNNPGATTIQEWNSVTEEWDTLTGITEGNASTYYINVTHVSSTYDEVNEWYNCVGYFEMLLPEEAVTTHVRWDPTWSPQFISNYGDIVTFWGFTEYKSYDAIEAADRTGDGAVSIDLSVTGGGNHTGNIEIDTEVLGGSGASGNVDIGDLEITGTSNTWGNANVEIGLTCFGRGTFRTANGDVRLDLSVAGIGLVGVIGSGSILHDDVLVSGYCGARGSLELDPVQLLGSGISSFFGNCSVLIQSVVSGHCYTGFVGLGEVEIDLGISGTLYFDINADGEIVFTINKVRGVGVSDDWLGIVLRYDNRWIMVPGNGYAELKLDVAVEGNE